MNTAPLLDVRNLKVHFPSRRQLFDRKRQTIRAVDEVSFVLHTGETLGLVGESGCGKTTLGRAVVRLVEPTAGQIFLAGQEITALHGSSLRAVRRKIQMIFQDPSGSLDPRMTAANIIAEALDIHSLTPAGKARSHRVQQLLASVGLDPAQANKFPHEFSGGQKQRIGLARALAVEPTLIVCDEPVSALDVSVQAQVINLLRDLQREYVLAYLFISHDLAVVEHISHRVMVMYLGKIVETGESRAVCGSPKHPYTKALISAVPTLDPTTRRKRIVLQGSVPSSINPPSGCAFHTRCPIAEPRCKTEVPRPRELAPGHWVSCHLA